MQEALNLFDDLIRDIRFFQSPCYKVSPEENFSLTYRMHSAHQPIKF